MLRTGGIAWICKQWTCCSLGWSAAAAAKSLQSCPTLCNLIDGGPLSLGFSGQEQWSGLPFPSPMHESEKRKVKSLSCARLLATPWTAAYQAPPSMGFSRQEYWSGVPLPSLMYYLVIFNSIFLNKLNFITNIQFSVLIYFIYLAF